MLANGTILLGNTQGFGTQAAILDPVHLQWTFVTGDNTNEEGYAVLQNGNILTTNPYTPTSMVYRPGSSGFVADANVPVSLGANSEIGSYMTLANGQLIWFGTSGHNAIYTPGATAGQNGSWVAAPDFPVVSGDQLVCNDAPALLEPTGRVLVSVNGQNTSQRLVEYDPATNSFSLATNSPIAKTALLMLPSGEALVATNTNKWLTVQFYGAVSSAPTITSFPSAVNRGTTVTLSGTQLCGLSEASTLGDDLQPAEAYPIVRLTGGAGAVQYLRAHDVTTRSIAPGQAGSVSVDIPAGLAVGTYSLQVVASGIQSGGVSVQVQ